MSPRDVFLCLLAAAWIVACFLTIVWTAGWAAGG